LIAIQAGFCAATRNQYFDQPYDALVKNASVGICTLGVGEPSKMSKEEFLKIDKQAV
jgi:hypothetical protein